MVYRLVWFYSYIPLPKVYRVLHVFPYVNGPKKMSEELERISINVYKHKCGKLMGNNKSAMIMNQTNTKMQRCKRQPVKQTRGKHLRSKMQLLLLLNKKRPEFVVNPSNTKYYRTLIYRIFVYLFCYHLWMKKWNIANDHGKRI